MNKRKLSVILLLVLLALVASLPIEAEEDLVSLKVREIDIKEVLVMLTEQSNINLVPEEDLRGKVTLNLKEVKIEEALQILTKTHNYQFKKTMSRTYVVSQAPNNNLSISVIEGKVTMVAENVNLGEVLRSISKLSNLNIILFGRMKTRVNLKLDDIEVEKSLKLILSGSRYTYKKKKDVYLVGEKNSNSPAASLLTSNELISLEYLQAEKVPKMLPSSIPDSIIKVISEQNAIMVTGTQADIDKVKAYVDEIDQKVPQVVVEALIIDISYKKSNKPLLNIESQENNISQGTIFDSSLGKITYNSITKLPQEFYVKLQSMIEQGEASVKANPNLTTLNGRKANIEVSDVTYYEVTKEDEDGQQQSKYESLDVGVNLQVTPWVSSAGTITLELKPEVSSPSTKAGAGETEGPPDIIRRQASTTVRVKDGQTIVLGGLMRDNKSKTISKVPLLGDIPLLGKLFRNKESTVDKTELVMYITPRIIKNNEADQAKMKRMLEKADEITGEEND